MQSARYNQSNMKTDFIIYDGEPDKYEGKSISCVPCPKILTYNRNGTTTLETVWGFDDWRNLKSSNPVEDVISRLSARFDIDLAKARLQFGQALFGEDVSTLKSLRLKKGLSQSQLAEAIGMSQPNLARLERGIQNIDPRLSTLRKLMKALAVDAEVIIEVFGDNE